MQNNKNNAIRKCKKCNHIQVQQMHTNKHTKNASKNAIEKKTCAKNAHSEIVCFLHFWDGLRSSKNCKNSMNMQKNVKHATSGTVHVLQKQTSLLRNKRCRIFETSATALCASY